MEDAERSHGRAYRQALDLFLPVQSILHADNSKSLIFR